MYSSQAGEFVSPSEARIKMGERSAIARIKKASRTGPFQPSSRKLARLPHALAA